MGTPFNEMYSGDIASVLGKFKTALELTPEGFEVAGRDVRDVLQSCVDELGKAVESALIREEEQERQTTVEVYLRGELWGTYTGKTLDEIKELVSKPLGVDKWQWRGGFSNSTPLGGDAHVQLESIKK